MLHQETIPNYTQVVSANKNELKSQHSVQKQDVKEIIELCLYKEKGHVCCVIYVFFKFKGDMQAHNLYTIWTL